MIYLLQVCESMERFMSELKTKGENKPRVIKLSDISKKAGTYNEFTEEVWQRNEYEKEVIEVGKFLLHPEWLLQVT